MNVAVIAFGGFLIMRGDLDYIDLITFSLYVGTFLQPIRRLSSFVEQYTVGMAGFSRFRELMAVEPDITDPALPCLPACGGRWSSGTWPFPMTKGSVS